ncbi:unnamed protein product [Caenorhabditis auriculariae]|uniref:Uncharacterized protein n=1 Tax=Caenorhabditis auriculariae TaxID=2777116 RepID=A0A8S1H4P0_9PELO|nr:unnamed protein product [Caenorhabditis auriculariae]
MEVPDTSAIFHLAEGELLSSPIRPTTDNPATLIATSYSILLQRLYLALARFLVGVRDIYEVAPEQKKNTRRLAVCLDDETFVDARDVVLFS